MYKRILSVPSHSFFLFGPRGTGKTTWLRQKLPDAKWVDLIKTDELLRYMRNPGVLRKEVEALPENSWIVIDEIQKLPVLLNDIHALIAEHGNTYRFAISGSSARKLKRLDANLLAGRVINRNFYPLTAAEIGNTFSLDSVLSFGCLPKVVSEPEIAVDVLSAYVVNYLQQEIQQEAFVNNLGAFSRFLEIAAMTNGQVVNITNIARDCGVARLTVQRFFEILESTLIGMWLPAWKPRAKIKEISHSKFYFFDTGVVRAITQTIRDPLEKAERGTLLETYVLHELRAYQNVSNCGGAFSYWRTASQLEADFIWKRGKTAVGIEVKATAEWRDDSGTPLKILLKENKIRKCFGVYTGKTALKDGQLDILPVQEFCKKLTNGEILA